MLHPLRLVETAVGNRSSLRAPNTFHGQGTLPSDDGMPPQSLVIYVYLYSSFTAHVM